MGYAIAAVALTVISASALAQYGRGSDCGDARGRAEYSASDLSESARRLQRCAEYRDFSDDCSTVFRRVRSYHSDYESAVSEVMLYCD